MKEVCCNILPSLLKRPGAFSAGVREEVQTTSSSTFFFLFVFLSLPLAVVAAVSPALAVACARLGRRQRLHAQDLVDLSEGHQPQGVLRAQGGVQRFISADVKATFFSWPLRAQKRPGNCKWVEEWWGGWFGLSHQKP